MKLQRHRLFINQLDRQPTPRFIVKTGPAASHNRGVVAIALGKGDALSNDVKQFAGRIDHECAGDDEIHPKRAPIAYQRNQIQKILFVGLFELAHVVDYDQHCWKWACRVLGVVVIE